MILRISLTVDRHKKAAIEGTSVRPPQHHIAWVAGLISLHRSILNVSVHEQIGHNAQKRVFLQHHSSGTTMSPELILGMAVIEG